MIPDAILNMAMVGVVSLPTAWFPAFVNAIFYIVVGGAQWQMLHKECARR